MSEELKPCDCGSGTSALVVWECGTGLSHMWCIDCDTEGPHKPTQAAAITAWNTRAGEKA